MIFHDILHDYCCSRTDMFMSYLPFLVPPAKMIVFPYPEFLDLFLSDRSTDRAVLLPVICNVLFLGRPVLISIFFNTWSMNNRHDKVIIIMWQQCDIVILLVFPFLLCCYCSWWIFPCWRQYCNINLILSHGYPKIAFVSICFQIIYQYVLDNKKIEITNMVISQFFHMFIG